MLKLSLFRAYLCIRACLCVRAYLCVRASVLEHCCPFPPVCCTFAPVVWLPVWGMVNVRTDVDAHDCTRGLCTETVRVCTEGDCGRKIPCCALTGIKPASALRLEFFSFFFFLLFFSQTVLPTELSLPPVKDFRVSE